MSETMSAPAQSQAPIMFDDLKEDVKPGADMQQQAATEAPILPSFDDLEDDTEKYESAGQLAKTAVEGVGRGVLGPIAPAIEKGLGVKEEDILGRMKTNPILSGVSEGAGFLGSMLIGTGEGAAIAKAGELAAGLTEAGKAAQSAMETARALGLEGSEASKMVDFMTQEVPTLSKVGASALRNAVEMAAMEGSNEVTKEILHDPERLSESALANVGLGAALGAGTGAFITGAVNPLWKATLGPKLEAALNNINIATKEGIENGTPDMTMRPIVKKLLASATGVSEKNIDEYLANIKTIKDVPEYEEVYQHTLDHVGSIFDAVEEQSMSVSKAKQALKEHETEIMESFRRAGADTAEAERMARLSLKDAQTKAAYDIEQRAMDAGHYIASGVEALRKSVIDQSAEAYNVLDKSGTQIKLKGFLDKGAELANKLRAEGTLEAKGQADRLEGYIAGIMNQFPEQGGLSSLMNQIPEIAIDGPATKALIQGLDKLSTYDFNASVFDKGMSRVYKQLRHELDATLKAAVPEYEKAMRPLAKDTALLSELTRYGDSDSAIKAVRSLRNPANYKIEMPLLKKLEAKTGVKFLQDIAPYVDKDLNERILTALPEYGEHQKLASALRQLKHPETKANIVKSLRESQQAAELREAEAKLAEAVSKKEAIKGVTPGTVQSKLKTLATPGKNIALEEVFKNIPELQGKSVQDIMNLLRINEAFDKNATRGSKHVNMYAALMGSLTHLLDFGGVAGLGIGALTGAAIDNSGPQLAKKILDKYALHFGNLGEMAAEGKAGAAKEMLGKVLGAEIPASAEGFKAGTDLIANQIKSHEALQRATNNIFKGGAQVAYIKGADLVASREKLDKQLDKYGEENSQMIASNVGSTRHYMQAEHDAMVNAVNRQVAYLKTLKPQPYKPGVLDKAIPPSNEQIARYERALDIANNPNIVLQHVKDGTIQVTDIQDLKAMWPALYDKMSETIMQKMSQVNAEETHIPYDTRIGLSLFLGQPLDSTMKPESIMAAQPPPKAPPPQQQAQGKAKRGTATLGKSNKSHMTQSQAAESDRATRD